MSLIIPANSAASGGYAVDNSCRFDGSSSYMQKTLGAPTSAKKATFSLWFKTSDTKASNGGRCLMSWGDDAGAIYVNETNDGQWEINLDNSDGLYKGTAGGQFSKDPTAWSHLCLIIDTTNGTANDRFQFFLNNVRVVFTANPNNNPDQNYDVAGLADGQVIAVGRRHSTTSLYYSGYMAEVCFIDGNNLAATNFGEVDEDSGIFKPIDVSGLTFGNNGFYLDFEASDNLGNDANGGTDLTESGLAATDQSTDTCTNNFATMNSLDNFYAAATLSEGNTQIVTATTPECWITGTVGLSTGKWFWEQKVIGFGSGGTIMTGIADRPAAAANLDLGKTTFGWQYTNGGYLQHGDANLGTWTQTTYTTNDIIGTALDIDNNLIYFYKNGTLLNSGTGIAITAVASTANGFWFPAFGDYNSGSATLSVNFGSPSFAISSGNTDGDGYGNFEYAVPSGYYALCTKNLAEYG